MRKGGIAFIIFLLFMASCQNNKQLILKSDKYLVYSASVVQSPFKASALSANEIVSNYVSPDDLKINSIVSFKFCINGLDNEMKPFSDHKVNLQPIKGKYETPLIKFGTLYTDENSENKLIEKDFKWHIRLDMKHIFASFKEKGYYELFDGQKLYEADFKSIYIVGGTKPLTWEFNKVEARPDLKLNDDDKDGIYEITLEMIPPLKPENTPRWRLLKDISAYPQYKSDQLLIDALYNLSLEEMTDDIRPDSTFMAGKEWNGVWTRDVSYSTALSLAILRPGIAKNSLLRKVKNKKIIQDTGTGGSWPVSTDRTIWALAAWEIYKVTGDKDWLEQIYGIIKNTTQQDLEVAFDKSTGLMCGESSFLDWREQTYPVWMEPVDIYKSKNLGTNAVHYITFKILAEIEKELHKNSDESEAMAEKIKAGINKYLWIDEKGFYGQYLYGRDSYIISPRFEALGEALCILFDIASPEKQKKIIEKSPICEFGVPTVFPQIPDINPYHNNSTWPFVQTFWTLASAKAQNSEAVNRGIGAIYRQAALFLTNKENFVAETGDYKGTAINSNRMLWSLAGNIALVYKLYFGMDFQTNGILFKPFVPRAFTGEKVLTNFKYRKMVMDIKLIGYGNKIKSFSIDGKIQEKPFIAAELEGEHKIIITLTDEIEETQKVNFKTVDFSPSTVQYSFSGKQVEITNYNQNLVYSIYKDGEHFKNLSASKFEIQATDKFSEYLIVSKDKLGYESFSGIPLLIYPNENQQIVEAESFAAKSVAPFTGYSGDGFIELSNQANINFNFKVDVPEEGNYFIDIKYANNSGPISTDNKCAIRTLWVNNINQGAMVFPQRGEKEWSNWGNSNSHIIKLNKGQNNLKLSLETWNENMNEEVNTAMVDYIRIIKK